MRYSAIEKILILQDRDGTRRGLETQLAAIPGETDAVGQKIAGEKSAIETARGELKALESKRKLVETEIGAAGEQLSRYKTQQNAVRKNDEYQALGQQIATTEAAIDGLEEKELEIMFAIDEAKKKFADAEAVLKANISGHEARIAALREREKNFSAELSAVKEQIAAARADVEDPSLRVYDRVAERTWPVCAAIRSGICGGCHLRITGEVETDVRKGDKLVTCDQCGRIV
ncbi:MAG: C4-type zinc ribbon domain-containing protein, partial [Opitutaceae bacterium]|nr:C4-type zinc ribbon domain-containing protein [Opitutaceae bacterium]